jgi:hypothetical protein
MSYLDCALAISSRTFTVRLAMFFNSFASAGPPALGTKLMPGSSLPDPVLTISSSQTVLPLSTTAGNRPTIGSIRPNRIRRNRRNRRIRIRRGIHTHGIHGIHGTRGIRSHGRRSNPSRAASTAALM